MRHKYVFGFLGAKCPASVRKRWNLELRSRQIDGFFDFYKASTISDLELRLSEMFLHGRRGYVVKGPLQKTILPLLDELDVSAKKKGAVDTIVNRGGVIGGYLAGSSDDDFAVERRLKIWEVEHHSPISVS